MSKRVLVEWDLDLDGYGQYIPPKEVYVPDDVPDFYIEEWLIGTYECNVKRYEVYGNDKN